jgi:hypothetical protein
MTLEKQCNKCLSVKTDNYFHKDKSKKDGLHTICKECQQQNKIANKENARETRKKYEKAKATEIKEYWKTYNSNPHLKQKLKEKHLLNTYNISLEDLEILKKAQKYSCAICGTHEQDCSRKTLFVDHCHSTNKIRGLLCSQCNSALGLLYDDESLLEKAITYLKKNK